MRIQENSVPCTVGFRSSFPTYFVSVPSGVASQRVNGHFPSRASGCSDVTSSFQTIFRTPIPTEATCHRDDRCRSATIYICCAADTCGTSQLFFLLFKSHPSQTDNCFFFLFSVHVCVDFEIQNEGTVFFFSFLCAPKLKIQAQAC